VTLFQVCLIRIVQVIDDMIWNSTRTSSEVH